MFSEAAVIAYREMFDRFSGQIVNRDSKVVTLYSFPRDNS